MVPRLVSLAPALQLDRAGKAGSRDWGGPSASGDKDSPDRLTAWRSHDEPTSGGWQGRTNAEEASCPPRSPCTLTPPRGRRCCTPFTDGDTEAWAPRHKTKLPVADLGLPLHLAGSLGHTTRSR